MKKIILLLATAALLTACVKPDDSKTIRFSILGDSYSAYKGHVQPDSNDIYHYENIDVTGPEQMWWAQVARQKGWTLERNNSFSGALVCNYDYVNYYGPYSFIRRADNLGKPDVIFVFGATNDACAHHEHQPIVALGDYIYSDWTEEQLCDYRPGLAYLFDRLKTLYPQAKLYFLLDMNLGTGGVTEQRRAAFIESTQRIAHHYQVECVNLWNIRKSQWHPNVEGQKDIADQLLEYLSVESF